MSRESVLLPIWISGVGFGEDVQRISMFSYSMWELPADAHLKSEYKSQGQWYCWSHIQSLRDANGVTLFYGIRIWIYWEDLRSTSQHGFLGRSYLSKVATSLKKTIPRSKLGNSDKSLMIGTANDSPLDGGDVDVLELSHFQNRAHGFGHSPGLPIGSHKCLSTISCTLLSYPGWFQTQKKTPPALDRQPHEIQKERKYHDASVWNCLGLVYLLIFKTWSTCPPQQRTRTTSGYFSRNKSTDDSGAKVVVAPLEDLWGSFCPTSTWRKPMETADGWAMKTFCSFCSWNPFEMQQIYLYIRMIYRIMIMYCINIGEDYVCVYIYITMRNMMGTEIISPYRDRPWDIPRNVEIRSVVLIQHDGFPFPSFSILAFWRGLSGGKFGKDQPVPHSSCWLVVACPKLEHISTADYRSFCAVTCQTSSKVQKAQCGIHNVKVKVVFRN